ncbi:MAG: phosphate ABC transporter permease PstA [Clostridiales bacterium]|nr:phosphate ABC transporter permease PstA [Clostridiales bacterium]
MPVVKSIYDKKSRPLDNFIYILIYFCAFISIVLLAGIVGYVGYHGISSINWKFLTTVPSAIKGTFGIAGNMINTLYIIIITLIISVPIGVGSAIYLNEYAKTGKLVNFIEFTTETLSGLPSIIFGLFGYVLFGQVLQLGYSILTGSLTLAIMVLPLITRNTQEALKAVPESYRSGALGIGSTKWYMIRTILLPTAMPGVITGVILSIGRIVGESAALLFTAGSGYLLPKMGQYGEGLFKKILQAGGTLTIQLYLSMEKGEYDSAFGIAFVLLVLVFGINLLTKYLSNKFNNNKQ